MIPTLRKDLRLGQIQCNSRGLRTFCKTSRLINADLMAFPLTFLIWNSRGVGSQEFMQNFHDLMGECHLVLVMILDTRQSQKNTGPFLKV